MLWFFVLLVVPGDFSYIYLYFLFDDHTKNRIDAAFGCVERNLLLKNVLCPANMMKNIADGSSVIQIVRSTSVCFVG